VVSYLLVLRGSRLGQSSHLFTLEDGAEIFRRDVLLTIAQMVVQQFQRRGPVRIEEKHCGASMRRAICMLLFWIIIATMPVLAQERLYPVQASSNTPTLLSGDHSAFVAEKTFEYKLTLGFPADDRLWFVPNTKTRMIVLWLGIENLSQHPMELDTTQFTCTDEQGRSYSVLGPDEASQRVIAANGGTQTLLGKAIHGISLEKAANKTTEDQARENALRYSLQSGQIPPRGIKDGLIYFEAPQRKKFTLNIGLGDLWSKPFIFAKDKPK
jgi:hypothetical protein